MMYLVLSILALAGGAAAWIMHLIQKIQKLKEDVGREQANTKMKEWADKISKQADKIKEEEREYEENKHRFDDNNPPRSGAV